MYMFKTTALRLLVTVPLALAMVVAPALIAPIAIAVGPTLMALFATACFAAAVIA